MKRPLYHGFGRPLFWTYSKKQMRNDDRNSTQMSKTLHSSLNPWPLFQNATRHPPSSHFQHETNHAHATVFLYVVPTLPSHSLLRPTTIWRFSPPKRPPSVVVSSANLDSPFARFTKFTYCNYAFCLDRLAWFVRFSSLSLHLISIRRRWNPGISIAPTTRFGIQEYHLLPTPLVRIPILDFYPFVHWTISLSCDIYILFGAKI